MKKRKKVCFISSAGGHFEQIKMLGMVAEKYDHYYVVPKNKSLASLSDKMYFVCDISRQNKLTFLFKFILSGFQQLIIFIKEHPDVVITTGAGVAVPTCIIARALSKKVVYIESFARIHSLNKTGKMLSRFSGLFIVQWKSLLKLNPKAVYGGWLY
ncbi:MAG: polysaccharide biosynthesis protein [Lachnospiraceae bacterium]|jgi:UDP-N-acetylglucosamine:LPS N-acetylglucosamine transferase|nr:polysaccharide biosynthesis protein [Lachnospiraceae bacterium]